MVVTGHTEALPVLGQQFKMQAKPLDPTMDKRLVDTAPITILNQRGDTFNFATHNSTYELTLLS